MVDAAIESSTAITDIATSAAVAAAAEPGGTVVLDSGPARWDGARPLTPSPTITCNGHSWIYSDNGLLEQAIANVLGVTVRNLGIGGQTSTEVAIRTGGIIPLLTLAGNQIPADTTPVSVTAIQPSGDYRTNGSSSYTYPGTLAGVPGTLTETLQAQGSNPVWTFTRTTAGDAVTVLPSTPFLVTNDAYEDETTVIMCAQNNLYTVDASMRSVMRDIEAIVGTLTPVVKRFLIVGEFTFPTDGDDATGGPLARRNKMLAINAERAARWPANFYDLRRDFIDIGMQVGGLVPSSDDISKINHDTTPLGILKSEADTHPNATGYAVVGKLIAKQLVARGWATYAGNTPPAAPTVTATGGAGAATVNVTAPNNGGSAVTDYVVQFRSAGTARWFTHFDGISTATSIPVSGLAAGSWEFRVTAINAIGPSDPSAVVSATVTASADTTPPTAPTSVTATAGDGQATVTFSGATDNVAVTQYRVYSNADSYTTPIATGTGSPITVTVPNGAPVRFQVSAGDAGNNWSSRSASSNEVTPTAAVPVTVIASDSFNRADGSVGSPDYAYGGSGKSWSPQGSISIIGNQLGTTAAGTVYCLMPHTDADQAVEAKIGALGTSNLQILLRRVDSNNFYRVLISPQGGGSINKTAGGTNTQLSSNFPAGTFAAGDVVKFRAAGSTLSLFKNGQLVESVTDTSITTSVHVAPGVADTTARSDDFKLTTG
ncbi:fibronectin type III domain-containing protein [Rhodococcus pyridinivorans]|uniref:fibronectin type III domain-containing protein n=1 Tax=Rhodococcus pyridinivorans TaxID=103816 RepID=UPI003417C24B